MGLEEGDRFFTEIMVEWAVSARFFLFGLCAPA